jgi:hypothetical protein
LARFRGRVALPDELVLCCLLDVRLRENEHAALACCEQEEPRTVKLSYEGSKVSIVSSGLQANEQVVSENSLLLAREFRVAEETAKNTAAANGKAADSK